MIAAVRRSRVLRHILQTDMVVHPGSMGAPLFDMKGEVVGMFTGRYVISGRRTPVGLVITSTLIKEETDKLQKFGVVDRGWLGVKTRKPTEEEASALKMDRAKSVVVVGLKAGGPAATAELAVGDGIAAFNGHPIRGAFSSRAGA